MDRQQAKARAEQDGRRTWAALALTGLAVLGLLALGAREARAAIDPAASAVLAGALKPQMQKTLAKSIPGIKVTKVACYVPRSSTAIAGPCTARFTVARYQLKGTYKAKASLASNSRLAWSTSSVTCSDLHGRRASCTGQTSSGNGLISAQLAEAQLLRNGFVLKGAKKKVRSAFCTGSKGKRWSHAKFDDVYSQLSCVVKAADGSYRVTFTMVGNAGYNLTGIRKSSSAT